MADLSGAAIDILGEHLIAFGSVTLDDFVAR
jgi:hypothetical protein